MNLRPLVASLAVQVLLAHGAFADSPEFKKFFFKDEAKTKDNVPCAASVVANISRMHHNQHWYPIAASEPRKNLMTGIAFRNTITRKAIKIYTDKKTTTLLEIDITGKRLSKSVFTPGRVHPNEPLRATLGSRACSPVNTDHRSKTFDEHTSSEAYGEDSFTDAKLYEVIGKPADKYWGVIYLWSPAMPLSVEGIREIKNAMATLGNNGKLVVLADGRVDYADVRKALELNKVDGAEVMQIASEELIDRGATLHYPAAIVFKDGFLSNKKYIGYKPGPSFARFIKKDLGDLDKAIAELSERN